MNLLILLILVYWTALLEQKLGRNVLFIACRHHIFEIILQAVFIEAKFPQPFGPNILFFKRFVNSWSINNKKSVDRWSHEM
jgi:hypothetical protein